MLILGLLVFGLVAGAVAQLILGTSGWKINWTMALVTGLIGSFVGGLLSSFLAGDGIQLRPSGLVGSIVGALIVSLAYQWWKKRERSSATTT
ncbi:MAG: GlsB/YeaQ/YmgE family stress response membrane protein [Microlunatus sp.]|nr:GlsB/YeaQ/YmgE family stress response membrane protein [Microlunatus sp.]MDN5771420.1 GlsB/YeaQ/YmgE family stress response membrane protein [Microlunatus sp.]